MFLTETGKLANEMICLITLSASVVEHTDTFVSCIFDS